MNCPSRYDNHVQNVIEKGPPPLRTEYYSSVQETAVLGSGNKFSV